MWTKNSWGNQHFFKMLIKKCWSRKMLRRKNVGNIPKNVDEKMFWQRFWKMLTKNVGNNTKKMLTKNIRKLSKKYREKMLATLPKNIHFEILNERTRCAIYIHTSFIVCLHNPVCTPLSFSMAHVATCKIITCCMGMGKASGSAQI
jgi:hypothetical protein